MNLSKFLFGILLLCTFGIYHPLHANKRDKTQDDRNKALEEDIRGKYIKFRCHDKAGMFCVVLGVIGLADRYEEDICTGFQNNFAKHGLYYDPKMGPNWWNYYFEPIKVGKQKNNIHVSNDFTFGYFFNKAELDLSRERCKQLIDTYIHLIPEIQNIIDLYYEENFEGFVIGIHYRGTDKYTESPRTDYAVMAKNVNELCASKKLVNPKIFVATDEQAFLDFMMMNYPGQVISYNSIRSRGKQPIHWDKKISDRYKLGEDAIVDSMLLSKCDYLIKTSSNLSLYSTMCNPNMPVIEVSKNYGR